MPKRAFLRLTLIGSLIFLFFLSSCGGSSNGTPTPFIPANALDVFNMNVFVNAHHTMDVNKPYQVSAVISSPDSATPLASLYGIFPTGVHQPQQGPLYQLLQPSSAVKSSVKTFALCMYVNLNVDPDILTVDPVTQKQWVVLAPDGNHAQNSPVWEQRVVWNVTPQDATGTEMQPYTITVNIGFDAEVSCGSTSLLPTPYSFQSSGGDHSIVTNATTMLVDEQLVLQKELVDTPRKIIGAILPTAQTILLGWVTGLFSWIGRQLKGGKSPESKQDATPIALAQEKKPISGWHKASCIAGIVLGALMLVGALAVIYFDPSPTITSTVIETAIALVGMALMIAGAWWIRPGKGFQIQEKLA